MNGRWRSSLRDDVVQLSSAAEVVPGLDMEVQGNVVRLAPIREASGVRVSKPPMGELGVGTAMPFTSFVDWVSGELLAPNNTIVSLDRLVEMRQKDGTVRALMRLLTLPIMRSMKDAKWIEPGDEDGNEEDSSEEVEFANTVFTLPPQAGGMSVSRTRFMRQVLLATVEGFAAFEKVYQVPDDGPLEGKVTWRKIAHRDARTVRFLVDDSGGFKGLKQITHPKGGLREIVIPQEKAWYFAVNEEENPLYGVSMFETAWHHWDIKRKLYYIWHVAAQAAAVPARVGSYPRSAALPDIAAFQKMLADFTFNTAGVHPQDFEVQFANQNTSFNFEAAVNHQNMQMAKSVLAKFLEDQDRQVLIDNGQTDASADFFVMSVESLMAEIAESMTHYLMPDLIDYNFRSDLYPEFKFGVLNDATKDVIKDLFTVVATAQSTKWTDEFIRELEKTLNDRLGMEVDYDAVEEREAEEEERQKQLEQAYFQQRSGGAEEEGGGFGGPAGGAPPGGGGPPQEVAASVSGGGLSLDLVMDKVEQLMMARRESDMDER